MKTVNHSITDKFERADELQHLDMDHSRLLYVILRKQHDDFRRWRQPSGRARQKNGGLPGATQAYLLEITGWQRFELTRALAVLKRGRFILTAKIHTEAARNANHGSREVYEVDSLFVITERPTAVMLLSLLDAEKDERANVTQDDLGKAVQKFVNLRSRNLSEHDAALAQKASKFQEEGEDEKRKLKRDELTMRRYVERSSVETLRPRLRIYLEWQYLDLIVRQPDIEEIEDEFRNGRRTKKQT